MPELPEVETIVRDLRPLLTGRTIQAVRTGAQHLRRHWEESWGKSLQKSTIRELQRRGKWILVRFHQPHTLLIHLGMTGQLTVTPQDTPQEDHTHFLFDLDQNQQLRFRDIRRFGSLTLFPTDAELQAFLADRLGPEPFDLDPTVLIANVQKSARPLKAILLDQTVIAGVGNIYADEACFRSRLHPARKGKSLDEAEIRRLLKAIQLVLRLAIDNRGSTIRNYVGGSGLKGEFQNSFHVYGRTGEKCTGCSSVIEVIRLAGRSTHYCPTCQTNE